MQASQLRLFVIQTAAVDSDVATNESLSSKMHTAAVPMLARSRDAPLVTGMKVEEVEVVIFVFLIRGMKNETFF
jgi:hypothetical protein